MSAVRSVGVVGLGTMGAGIAEVFARAGLQVTGVDADDAAVARGRGHLEASLARAVRRGRLDGEERDAVLARVGTSTDLAALADVDLVVEAVPERLEVKTALLARLDEVCRADALLCTNTSSLSVTRLASATRRPDRVVGMHFFNPAPVLALVEVVRHVRVDPGAVTTVEDLARRVGKRPVTVGDRAGFVANALLFGYLGRAVRMLESGHVSAEDLDAAVREGAGLPMGPLALLDLVGLDTAVEILRALHAEDPRRHAAPAPSLVRLVDAGLLGRKTGAGFFTYGESEDTVDEGPAPASDGLERVAVVGEGAGARSWATALREAAYDVMEVSVGDAALAAVVPVERGLGDRQLVVEAGGGDLAATRTLLSALTRSCRAGTVLVMSSGLLRVTEAAAATSRPADVVGMHPVLGGRSAVVEVAAGVQTSPGSLAAASSLAARLGWRTVRCGDRAGRVVDALLLPHLNDAARMVEEDYASAADVDTAMTAGCGYPVGPVAQADALGLDVVLRGLTALQEETHDPQDAPTLLLRRLVASGRLGRGGDGLRTHRGG